MFHYTSGYDSANGNIPLKLALDSTEKYMENRFFFTKVCNKKGVKNT